MTTWVHEFLFRGHKPDSGDTPAWHVVIADDDLVDGNGEPFVRTRTLNMAQAEAEGIELPGLISEINAAIAAERDVLAGRVAALEAQAEQSELTV